MSTGVVRSVAGLANVETRDDDDVIEEVDLSNVAVPRGYAKRHRGTVVVLGTANREKRTGNGAQGGR